MSTTRVPPNGPVIALMLGIFSCLCGCFAGLPAVVVGLYALGQAETPGERFQAKAGIFLGGLMTVAFFVFMATDSFRKEAEEEAKAEAAAQAEAEQLRLEQEEKNEIQQNISGFIANTDEALDRFGAALNKEAVDEAKSALAEADSAVQKLAQHDIAHPKRESLTGDVQDASHHLEATRLRAEADLALTAGDFIKADKLLRKALDRLGKISERYRHKADSDALSAVITKTRKSFKRSLKKAEEEANRRAALNALCGDAPTISGWDGGNTAVARYMKNSAHDPSSIEVQNCTRPILTDACWRTTCQVRGKNAFGALVLNVHTFYLGRSSEIPSMHQVLAVE